MSPIKLTITLLMLFLTIFANAYNKNDVENIVVYWNKACNEQDISKFKTYYADKLIYYGKELSKSQAILDKIRIYKKYRKFNQYISSPITQIKYSSGIIKCEFNKSVQVNNKNPRAYPSYILIREIHGRYFIVGESDLLTDNKLNYTLDLGEQATNFNFIIIVFIVIVFISLVLFIYKKNFKNNGTKSINVVESGVEFKVKAMDLNESQIKGYLFEQHIVSLFSNEKFILNEWRSDKISDNISPESSKYPDLEYELMLKDTSCKFAVECKWRMHVDSNNKIKWAEDYQIINYNNFSKKFNMPVFIVIGIGGTPNNPNAIYSIPLEKLYKSEINLNQFETYKRYNANRPFFLNLNLNKLV